MALIKQKLHKGFPANYWTILKRYEDKFSNRTHLTIGLFLNKEHYESVKGSPEWESHTLEVKEVWVEGIDLTREELYEKIKIPAPVEQVNHVTIPDPENEGKFITTQENTTVETNFFADAEDDL